MNQLHVLMNWRSGQVLTEPDVHIGSEPDLTSDFQVTNLLPELLQHRQVELVEEAEGQSPSVRHHAARRRRVQGHLFSQ